MRNRSNRFIPPWHIPAPSFPAMKTPRRLIGGGLLALALGALALAALLLSSSPPPAQAQTANSADILWQGNLTIGHSGNWRGYQRTGGLSYGTLAGTGQYAPLNEAERPGFTTLTGQQVEFDQIRWSRNTTSVTFQIRTASGVGFAKFHGGSYTLEFGSGANSQSVQFSGDRIQTKFVSSPLSQTIDAVIPITLRGTPSEGGERVLWKGDLTATQMDCGHIKAEGYVPNNFCASGTALGTLVDDRNGRSFVYDAATYTIDGLWTQSDGRNRLGFTGSQLTAEPPFRLRFTRTSGGSSVHEFVPSFRSNGYDFGAGFRLAANAAYTVEIVILPSEGVLWHADITPGNHPTSAGGTGWSNVAGSDHGSINGGTTFTEGEVTFTVESVLHSATSRALSLTVNASPASAFGAATLCLGGLSRSFPARNSDVTHPILVHNLSAPPWTVGTPVRVGIVRAPATCATIAPPDPTDPVGPIAADETLIWTGTLGAGDQAGTHGYSDINGSSFGTLDPDTFGLEGSNFTVRQLSSSINRLSFLVVNQGTSSNILPSGTYRLYIGNTAYELTAPAGRLVSYTHQHNNGSPMTSGQSYTVRLVSVAPPPPTLPAKLWESTMTVGESPMTVGNDSQGRGYYFDIVGGTTVGALQPSSSIQFSGHDSPRTVSSVRILASSNVVNLELGFPYPATFAGVMCADGLPWAFDQETQVPGVGLISSSNHDFVWNVGQQVPLSIWEVPAHPADYQNSDYDRLCAAPPPGGGSSEGALTEKEIWSASMHPGETSAAGADYLITGYRDCPDPASDTCTPIGSLDGSDSFELDESRYHVEAVEAYGFGAHEVSIEIDREVLGGSSRLRLYVGSVGYDLRWHPTLQAYLGDRAAPLFETDRSYRLRLVELVPVEISIVAGKSYVWTGEAPRFTRDGVPIPIVWEGQPAPFLLRANDELLSDVDVTVTISSDLASDDLFDPYRNKPYGIELGERTFRMNAGTSWRYFELPTTDDDVDGKNGFVTAEVMPGDSGTYTVAASPGNMASLAIADNDLGPASLSNMRVTADVPFIVEGNYADFTFTADQPQPWDVALRFKVTARGDQQIPGGTRYETVTLLAGQTSATYTFGTTAYSRIGTGGDITVQLQSPYPDNFDEWYSVHPAYDYATVAVSEVHGTKPTVHVSVNTFGDSPSNNPLEVTEGDTAYFAITVLPSAPDSGLDVKWEAISLTNHLPHCPVGSGDGCKDNRVLPMTTSFTSGQSSQVVAVQTEADLRTCTGFAYLNLAPSDDYNLYWRTESAKLQINDQTQQAGAEPLATCPGQYSLLPIYTEPRERPGIVWQAAITPAAAPTGSATGWSADNYGSIDGARTFTDSGATFTVKSVEHEGSVMQLGLQRSSSAPFAAATLCAGGLSVPIGAQEAGTHDLELTITDPAITSMPPWTIGTAVKVGIVRAPETCADIPPPPLPEGVVWQAEMTPAQNPLPALPHITGWAASGYGSYGSLVGDQTFTEGGRTFTLQWLRHNSNDDSILVSLGLSATASFEAATLCIDGLSIPIPAQGSSTGSMNLTITDPAISSMPPWTLGTPFTVGIVRAPATCADLAPPSGNSGPAGPSGDPGPAVQYSFGMQSGPLADAGPDLTANVGQRVTLQGTGSFNPYGAASQLTHQWTQVHGSPVVLSGANRGDPSFTVPANAADGDTLIFKLTVTDREGVSSSDETVVTVSGPPRPTACAGPDQIGAPGATVTLQGNCSTNPYGKWHHLAHAWTQPSGPTVQLSDATKGDPSFTLPDDAADGTAMIFRLTVTDREGRTDSDTVVVKVDSTPPPTPPTACAGDDLEAQPGDTVTLEGTCSTNPHGIWWRMAHLWTQPAGQNIVLSDPTKGKPTFTMPTDAAPGTVYTFTLTVTDQDGESDSDDMTVSVPTTTGNSQTVDPPPAPNGAPTFEVGSGTTRSIAENSPAGTSVGAAFTANDPDSDPLTYSLSGTDAAAFAIDEDSGQITTVEGVTYDFEAKVSYSLTVTADDGNGGTAAIAITVSLTNVNEAPTFSEGSSTTRAVAENSPAGTSVGAAITATDPEGDKLTYALLGTDASAFAIDEDSGQLTTVAGVTYDYETRQSYQVTVAAGDPSLAAASIAVTVNLTDVAEAAANQAPVFDDGSETTRSIAENSPAGTDVGAAITATDPEGDTVTYALLGTDASAFAIDEDSGQLTTVEGVTYDYETKNSYRLAVDANDGNGGAASIAVTVTLTDVDETQPNGVPVFDDGSSASRSIPENSPAGTNVGAAITATDPDSDPLKYSLSGTDAAAFAIDNETGQLTTKEGVTYDFEAKASYTLAVDANDGNGGAASIAVTVSLTNVNEAPAFGEGDSTTRAVAENSPAGTEVGDAIAATDPDGGDTLTYSLSGTDASSFEIGNSTGQLTTKSDVEYDYETKNRYELTVSVSDGNGATASIAVTVSLTNVDETPPNRAPVFDDGSSATRSIAENSAAGVNVGDAITATDLDGDTLTYTLSGTDAGSFAINRDTGQLTTKSGVDYDYETKSSYEVTVEADDGRGGTASIAVTIKLTDVAEATPVTACFTNLGTLTAAADFAGSWDDANCKAHHQDSLGRYFHFTLSEETTVSISLSAGALYVSKDTPQNGWGTAPKGTYEHRKNVRRGNGKLVHDGSNSATLTLVAGETYTVEAAGTSGDFTVSIAPQ